MKHKNRKILEILRGLDLGSSVAEQDNLLETARIDTSAFNDLVEDHVDLIPGTKGSGKTALYRIIVDFLQQHMLERRKVVVAHGVRHHGDQVFQVFRDRFGKLSEPDFVDFWCIYLISLANEHFIKSPIYAKQLKNATREIREFNEACVRARIPSFAGKRTLLDVLDWTLTTVQSWLPKRVRYKSPHDGSELEVDLFGNAISGNTAGTIVAASAQLPVYVGKIKVKFESVLQKCDLNLWLMIDRLDEIFPRRSPLETKALRGLLRTLRIFESPTMRVKIFLRDDILEQIVDEKGFTALSHVAARQAKPLRWTEDQILCLIVRRIFAHKPIADYLHVDPEQLDSVEYAREAFYKVFPNAVYRGERRISTSRWIYSRASDGRGVVTPRDVIEMLRNAVQYQQEAVQAVLDGDSDEIISSAAIRDGYQRMSKDKLTKYLKAEFPHLWSTISKFSGGKTEYSEANLDRIFGKARAKVTKDLVSIGVLRRERRRNENTEVFKIPFLYRASLETTQGRMRY